MIPSSQRNIRKCSHRTQKKTSTSIDEVAFKPHLPLLVLIPPNVTPRSDKHFQWETLIDISLRSSNMRVGPFNFEPLTSYYQTKHTISHKLWKELKYICMYHQPQALLFCTKIINSNQDQRERKNLLNQSVWIESILLGIGYEGFPQWNNVKNYMELISME